MARRYNTYAPGTKHGQEVVQPFKKDDWEKMTHICLTEMEKYPEDSVDYYRWYRNYMMLVIGVNVGARIADLLEFTPRTFAGGRCAFTAHKTGKKLRYDIDKGIYSQIRAYETKFNLTMNQFLFRTIKDKKEIQDEPITTRQALRIVHRIAAAAGIDYCVGTHSLRKSYGRWLYDSGMNLTDVAKLLQHNSPIVTLRYICLDSEDVRKERESIAFTTRYKPGNRAENEG